MLFPLKTARIFPKLFPQFTWHIPNKSKEIYLTFDDGPIPRITEWVIELLAKKGVQATFFCVGDNIRKHPQVFAQLLLAGHRVGNHTFNHLNGWTSSTNTYLENVEKCKNIIQEFSEIQKNKEEGRSIFRPPYGRIRPAQVAALLAHYEIVLWDVLSGDFSPNLSPQRCLAKTSHYVSAGSIIVFHDSLKSERILRTVLPEFIANMLEEGYIFKTL